MRNSGVATQVVGVVIILGGVVVGFLTAAPLGLVVIVGGILLGLLLICLGNAFYALGDVVNDTKRGADALDRIAKAQTGVASSLPPDAAKRLRELGTPQKQ